MVLAANMERGDLLRGLAEKEQQTFLAIFKPRKVRKGESVFVENEDGDTLFYVERGSVHITRWITEGDLMKTLFVAAEGDVFGEMAFMDRGGRSAMAVADADTDLRTLSRDDFDAWCETSPRGGAVVLNNLMSLVVGRLRTMNRRYMEALQSEIAAAGGHRLNLQNLASASLKVRVELVGGKTLSGRIASVERSEAGNEVILRDARDRLFMIPYHAVSTIAFDEEGPSGVERP